MLVTPSAPLADAVEAELARRVPLTKHAERIATALAGPQSAVILVDDLDAAVEVADAYAAEHLEIQTRDAAAVAARVSNAGAVFVGPWSPVSLGDYCAGSNHVLPTGGCALLLQRAGRAVVRAERAGDRVRRASAARGRPARRSPSPPPRTCPPTARPSRARLT